MRGSASLLNCDVRQMLTVLIAILSSASHFVAQPCERLAADPEVPIGLVGRYEIVGRRPNSNETYEGTVSLNIEGDDYRVERTIGEKVDTGVAWIQVCTPDDIWSIRVQFTEEDQVFNQVCSFSTDGDNYFRWTCRTGYGARHIGRMGIEAWFQVHE